MTFENEVKPVKLPLKMDLQFFADGEDDDNISGDEELAAAIRGLLDSENQDDDDYTEPEDEDEDNSDDVDDSDESDDDDSADDYDDVDDEDDDEPADKKQSKADNARFAQERRERQARERAEQELERLKQESPEFQLAKMLSESYGQPVEVIMEQIKEEQLKREAEQQKVPVDVLRKQRDADERSNRLEQEIAMLKFQNWQTQTKADGTRLMNEYKMLTQADIDRATDYILNVAKNVDLPLEDAVFAVHGKKIVESLAKGKVQDELANQSGRKKKTPLAPNNGKPSKVVTLSADEQVIAKAFNMTADEYLKYKS